MYVPSLEEEVDLVAEVEAEAVMVVTLVDAAVAATWAAVVEDEEVDSGGVDSGDVVVDAKYKCIILLT